MGGMFTMPLKEVLDIEQDAGNGFRIGLDAYPIFDPAYRDGLNRKIIEHFWNREIGLETISLFTFNLRRKMNEVMPYYNQVYRSTLIEFDPLATFDLSTIRNDSAQENNTGTSTTNATGVTSSSARTVNSETPQAPLAGNEDYATSATDANSAAQNTNSGTGNTSNTGTSTANGTSATKGFQGAASDLLTKFRATLINTDMMVIGELNELFMGVWDNRSEMLPNRHSMYELDGWY